MTVEWREPPLVNRPGVWIERLAPLLDRPGEWAMFYRHSNQSAAASAVHGLRTGRVRTPPGKWEFASSGEELFARYIGPT